MKLSEALEWAADYAERNKLFVAPSNSRGYPADGWNVPQAAEKARIIMDLAKSVADEPNSPIGTSEDGYLMAIMRDCNRAAEAPDPRGAIRQVSEAIRSHLERKSN